MHKIIDVRFSLKRKSTFTLHSAFCIYLWSFFLTLNRTVARAFRLNGIKG